MYSVYRPDLAALGAIDGRAGSGRPPDNDDALSSRRDMGLEFLDVTSPVNTALIRSTSVGGGRREDVYRTTSNGTAPVDTHLLVIVRGLSLEVELENASGRTSDGDPYIREFLPDGVLPPGQSILVSLRFKPQAQGSVSYTRCLDRATCSASGIDRSYRVRDFATVRSRLSRICDRFMLLEANRVLVEVLRWVAFAEASVWKVQPPIDIDCFGAEPRRPKLHRDSRRDEAFS